MLLRTRLRRRQQGLSLVELMISLTMGAMITAGVVRLFSANSEAYRVLQGQARMQESARFAMEFLRRDVENAGRLGCNSNLDPDDATFYFNQVALPPPFEYDIHTAFVQGYEGQAGGAWLPAPGVRELPGKSGGADTRVFLKRTGIKTDKILQGTDILVFRGIERTDMFNYLESSMTTASQKDIKVVRPADGVDGLGFVEDELVLIHDCEKATLFQVTDITDTDPIVLSHATGVRDWSNASDHLTTLNTYQTDAAVSAVVTSIYYIAPGAGQNRSGSTPLSLWRKQGIASPVELVEGIEDLQILYGIGNAGFPARYVTANQIGDRQIYTVRVSLVANTIDDVGGTVSTTHGCKVQTCYDGEAVNGIDGLQRRTFTQTVALRN